MSKQVVQQYEIIKGAFQVRCELNGELKVQARHFMTPADKLCIPFFAFALGTAMNFSVFLLSCAPIVVLFVRGRSFGAASEDHSSRVTVTTQAVSPAAENHEHGLSA